MQFASLTGLWFALTLVPIIMMYLFKRKYIDTEVASHLLWNRVMKEMEANRPWQKLRNNLLLLLQLLIAALLVLALMQPFIWAKDSHRDHLLLIIDQSASMNSLMSLDQEDSVTRLEEAKHQMLEWIQHKPRGQSLTLLGMSEQAEVYFTRETNISFMEKAMEKIKVHYGRTAYNETLSLAAALTKEENAEIRIFTDGQWTEGIQGLTFHVPVSVEQLAKGTVNNVSIMQFGVKRDQALGEAASAVATLKNWGEQSITLDVSVFTGKKLHEIRNETLEAGGQKTIYYNDLPTAEYYQIVLDSPDLLIDDNISYAFLEGDRPKRALLLTEGNLFLEKALGLSDVTILKAQVEDQGLFVLPESEYDFIILDSIDPKSFETKGWQQALNQHPIWYINVNLLEHTRLSPNTEYKVEDHPVTQHIHFQDVHIADAQAFERIPWGEAIVSSGDIPLIYAGDVEGNPNILFTFDIHDSDLPLRSDFPVLVRNIVDWLSSNQTNSLGNAIAGEEIELSLSAETTNAYWASSNLGENVLDAAMLNEAVTNVQSVPSTPGLYRFVEMNQAGKEIQSRLLHVQMDGRESNLNYIHPLEFSMVERTDQNIVPDDSSDKIAAGFIPSSIIPWIVIVLLGLIFLEWGVYQRGASL